jgi:hypothetical protein
MATLYLFEQMTIVEVIVVLQKFSAWVIYMTFLFGSSCVG